MSAPDRLPEDIVERLRWAAENDPLVLEVGYDEELITAADELARLRAERAELLSALRRLKREHETVVIRAVELLHENGCDCDSAERMLEGSRPFQDAAALHAKLSGGKT